jgi:ABC-type transport system substrate-binding protein/class 3 adenylate cyclase/predicted Ser/Thr protein kinase
LYETPQFGTCVSTGEGTTTEIALGSTLAGFRVERLLGRGAMGAVYLAEDVHLRRKAAIKVLGRELAEDDRFRRRFLLESQLAAGLEHPHIVPIYAAGEEDDVLFLAMKYVEGYDLRELVGAESRIDEERALGLLSQVADALDAAHGLGLVHRDVKPANILVEAGETERAYLCDFGLARHASTVESLTSERAFVGTIAYIAPEQIESGAVDARADVYALGCVLFECLTGATPFERDTELQVVFAHLKEPPPLVTSLRPDLPAAIDSVIEQALAKSPDDRYSTCAELIAGAVEAMQVSLPEIQHSIRRTIPGIRTFLITDIRGYTRYTAEHGDEAAAQLASRFAEIVGQVVEEREGRLIELRGDEALVVFDSARQALRSAVELQSRVVAAGLPRGIGVGLDAGEAVPVADGYRGGALNLAARLCSIAGPGEILASETVLQLARTMEEIRYGERRVERVKGIAKPVTAVEVLPAHRRARRWERKRLQRAARRALRRPAVRLGLAAAVASGVAAAFVLTFAGAGPAHAAIAQQSVGFVSPAGKLEGQLPVSGAGSLGLVAGTLWFANSDDQTFERIDPRTRKLIHPFVSVQDGFGGAAFGYGGVWAVDGLKPVLLHVDPRYRTVQRIKLPADPGQIDLTAPTGAAVGAGSVWVAEANEVFRVDPSTMRVIRKIHVPQADQLAFGDGKLWVVSDNTSTISEIDPGIDQVVRKVLLHDWISSIAVGGGYVWATVVPDDELWKIDENGTVQRTFDIGHEPASAAFFAGHAWIGSNGKLSRVDPTSDEVTDFPIIDRPGGLAVGNNVLYVNTDQSPPKLPALPASQVATFSLAEDWLDDIDPAHAWPNTYRLQLEYATEAQLLNYPDASGRRGSELRPEVAAAMPTVSADGRTYTFRIRHGFRFSPPSHQTVTAETFRYSIERALSQRLGPGTPGIFYLGDVVGARAFNAGKTAHVSGITVQGDLLSIRLVAPAGDFLTRLSMPFFAAVPIGTPIVSGGVQTPIPSAGPYYLKIAWQDDLRVLERNPNYTGPRPHRLERIVYDINNSAKRTIGQIQSGTADYSADLLGQTTFAPNGPLAARYGHAGAARTSAPKLVETPTVGLQYLLFNTASGPFADRRLRRAASLVIDRRRLAAAAQGLPTGDLLPPALAQRPLSYFSLSPRVAAARVLAGPRHRTAVLYLSAQPTSAAVARILKADLARIGVTLRVEQVDDTFAAIQKPGAHYDILALGWWYDWPDPYDFFNLQLTTGGYRPPWPFPMVRVPASYTRGLERAATLRGAARRRAYARLDLELAKDVVPFAAYAVPVLPEFFSARLGCHVEQPILGAVDIGALCVRKS